MEYKMLADIDFNNSIDERVFVVFLAKEVAVLPQKNGQQFISITMKHKNLEINAKLFGASQEDIDRIKEGKVYNAAIDVKPYNKSPSGWACTIYNIEENNQLQAMHFVEWAEGMIEAQEVINKTLAIISESEYRDIVYNILSEYWQNFFVWSAASGMHHNVLGGLLVHTAEVIEICDLLADLWNTKYDTTFINKPLLLSAALLHDLAKIDELNVDKLTGKTEYSTHSALATHTMDMLSKIDIHAYRLGLGRQINSQDSNAEPKTKEEINEELEIINILKHCIAAHHGKLEYGATILPHTPEAYLLNRADEISAEMYKYNKEFKSMESASSSHNWTSAGINVVYKDGSKI